MRAKNCFVLSVCVLCAALYRGAFAAETSPPKKSAAEWIEQLGADKFAEREAAMAALKTLGAVAEAPLKKALEAPDAEVRRRAAMVLAALTPVDFSGDFVRIGSESLDEGGSTFQAVNEKGTATLSIDKGHVFLTQNYSSMKVCQTYTFPPASDLKIRGSGLLKIIWSQISQMENYFPDSGDPRLSFENTPNGARVTFEATDTSGTKVKMLFARQADINKDPALKAALDAQTKALDDEQLLIDKVIIQPTPF